MRCSFRNTQQRTQEGTVKSVRQTARSDVPVTRTTGRIATVTLLLLLSHFWSLYINFRQRENNNVEGKLLKWERHYCKIRKYSNHRIWNRLSQTPFNCCSSTCPQSAALRMQFTGNMNKKWRPPLIRTAHQQERDSGVLRLDTRRSKIRGTRCQKTRTKRRRRQATGNYVKSQVSVRRVRLWIMRCASGGPHRAVAAPTDTQRHAVKN